MEIIRANHGQLVRLYLTRQGEFLTKVEGVTSIVQIYGNGREPVTIAEFRRDNPELTAAMLFKLIGDALVWFGSEHDINDEAGKMLVRRLMENYYYFSFEDVSLALKMKSAEHKFGKLSAADVYSWFREYDGYRDRQMNLLQPEPKYEPSPNAVTREEYMEMMLRELCPKCNGDTTSDAYRKCKLMHTIDKNFKIDKAYLEYKARRLDRQIKEEEKRYGNRTNHNGSY